MDHINFDGKFGAKLLTNLELFYHQHIAPNLLSQPAQKKRKLQVGCSLIQRYWLTCELISELYYYHLVDWLFTQKNMSFSNSKIQPNKSSEHYME